MASTFTCNKCQNEILVTDDGEQIGHGPACSADSKPAAEKQRRDKSRGNGHGC
jgi:hypothetical protein